MDETLAELLDPIKWQLAAELLPSFPAEAELNRSALYDIIERPPEQKMGDFALPCFRFAKQLRQAPQKIAADLVDDFNKVGRDWVESASCAGPFVNITLRPGAFASSLNAMNDASYFEGFKRANLATERVMVEYSQPNTHKEFHVGHVRNACLGDSLCRLLRYCSYDIVAANYPGDEGTHIAKCLWYLRREGLTPPAEHRGRWLGEIYTAANRVLGDASKEQRAEYDKEVSAVLRAIEAKEGDLYDLWKDTRQWSLDEFNEIYEWLDVGFDHYFYESELSEESHEIVEEYLKKGVFKEDQGAIGIDLNEWNLGFCLLRKSDGNTLYATKDLALARRKFEDFAIERAVIVVAQEQRLHFQQVFKTLELMGFPQASNCFHLSYGLVRLPEGKMSSRDGTSVTFHDLRKNIEAELGKVFAKYIDEWSEDEIKTASHRLAVGAIKYGMLNTDPVKDVQYRAEDWVAFEGDTGPYLMYSYARACSILRKAAAEDLDAPDSLNYDLLSEESERVLVRSLYSFNAVAWQSCQQSKPSIMSHRMFEMCKAFSRFYSAVQVLKIEDDVTRRTRLALICAFRATLEQGLGLLGITPPERM